jgi:plasmid stability protein
MKPDTALPSIQIDAPTKKRVRLRSVNDGVSISAAIRAFLRAWIADDKRPVSIIEEIKAGKK